jgi:riboflavin biosynthesis pyrimidine reductase
VIANFVSTLDGVVALGDDGPTGGAEISGGSRHDHLIVALLRAVADVVVVGAGTVRASPRHRWTFDPLVPELAGELRQLRERTDKSAVPDIVVISSSGDLDPYLPIFQVRPRRSMIVTTDRGKRRLGTIGAFPDVEIVSTAATGSIDPSAVVDAIQAWRPARLVLVEGGPTLFERFLAERRLDELFLTIAPQIAGRGASATRPGLVNAHLFAPRDSRWGRLSSLRRVDSHLFARYAFERS